jgi:hypothetical protein
MKNTSQDSRLFETGFTGTQTYSDTATAAPARVPKREPNTERQQAQLHAQSFAQRKLLNDMKKWQRLQ